jgi:plastocyanin domain-containing protein
MNKFNIKKSLVAGENIIEFTPNETGRIPFSCGMGMYTGAFNVVGKDGAVNNLIQPIAVANASGNTVAGSCGGGGGGCGCGGGGGAPIKKDVTATVAQAQGDTQIINAVYTAGNYLQPNSFKVKAGTNVKFNIDVKDNGQGCGYAVMIRGLYNNALPLQAGQPITMEFTPTTPGSYNITCSMGMINFGTLLVE